MGALGAHALKDVLTAARLESWDTACLYMLVMGAALVGVPASQQGHRRALDTVLVGTWLFSGSIVVGCLGHDGWGSLEGSVTPWGVLMIGDGRDGLFGRRGKPDQLLAHHHEPSGRPPHGAHKIEACIQCTHIEGVGAWHQRLCRHKPTVLVWRNFLEAVHIS